MNTRNQTEENEMNCQYTGLELESKRMKNHPAVAALLNDAQRKGVYGVVVQAMNDAKASGITGMEVVEIGRAALTGGVAAASKRTAEFRAYEQRRATERSQEIQERNQFFMNNGRWPGQVAEDDHIETEVQPNGNRYSDQTEEGLAGRGL
jgi:hypothetical protein